MSATSFVTTEVRILDNVGTISCSGKFVKSGKSSPACLVANDGPSGAWIVFGYNEVEALNQSDGVEGTSSTYVMAGDHIIIGKGESDNFAAITDEGNAKLYFHAGRNL